MKCIFVRPVGESNSFISKPPSLGSSGLKQQQLNWELPQAGSRAVHKHEHPLQGTSKGITQEKMEPSIQEVMWTMKTGIKGGMSPAVEVPSTAPHKPVQKQIQSPAARACCKSTPQLSSFKLCMGAKGAAEGFPLCRTQMLFNQ